MSSRTIARLLVVWSWAWYVYVPTAVWAGCTLLLLGRAVGVVPLNLWGILAIVMVGAVAGIRVGEQWAADR